MLEKCIGGYTSTVSELPKPPEKHHYRQQFLRWIRNSTTELQIQLKTVSGQWYFLMVAPKTFSGLVVYLVGNYTPPLKPLNH